MPDPNFIFKALAGSALKRQQLIADISAANAQRTGQQVSVAHDPERAVFVDANDRTVATGYTALLVYLNNNPTATVYLKEAQKKHDLALEGGGAFGFAHLGTLHAMALKGIWFDRVAGTSAGALAAALVAGGYRVDINYKTTTDIDSIAPLQPSRQNSLNQIMFEDIFGPFTDYEQRIPQVRAALRSNRSAIYQLLSGLVRSVLKDHLSIGVLKDAITVSAKTIQETYFKLEKAIIDSILNYEFTFPVPLLPDARIKVGDVGVGPANIRSFIGNANALSKIMADVISAPVKKMVDAINSGTGPVIRAIDDAMTEITVGLTEALADALLENLITKKPQLRMVAGQPEFSTEDGLNQAGLGIFRLLEYGGFWEGNYIRDWVEKHLQQLTLGTGPLLDGRNGKPNIKDMTGAPARAILFKDLRMDLCIIAADMGLDGSSRASTPVPVYFSRRTTPDYPVAEAVRRSMSLPFVFIPRSIDDGYGNNPPDVPNYSNDEHHGHLLQDGGLFINLPVAVFRDADDFVFQNKSDSKTLVISNINAGKTASTCPDDVPECEFPEPVRTIKDTIKKIAEFSASLMPPPSPNVERKTPGIIKLKRSFEFIMNYAVNIHQENEINGLLRLVPNSFFVDIPVRDPIAVSGSAQEFSADGRLDSGNFDMNRSTKKWLVQNAFEAAKQAFKIYEEDHPQVAGKLALPNSMNPYDHLLQITNAVLSTRGEILVRPRAKFGDKAYTNTESYIVTLNGLSNTQIVQQIPLGTEYVLSFRNAPDIPVMKGMGLTWIKMMNESSNRTDAATNFLSFTINIRSRVYVGLDERPAFATTTNGWQEESFLMILSSGLHTSPGNAPTKPIRLFSKIFEAGFVTIPGPRNTTIVNNIYAYTVLARPV